MKAKELIRILSELKPNAEIAIRVAYGCDYKTYSDKDIDITSKGVSTVDEVLDDFDYILE